MTENTLKKYTRCQNNYFSMQYVNHVVLCLILVLGFYPFLGFGQPSSSSEKPPGNKKTEGIRVDFAANVGYEKPDGETVQPGMSQEGQVNLKKQRDETDDGHTHVRLTSKKPKEGRKKLVQQAGQEAGLETTMEEETKE